jgi:hypothetical protein
MGSKYFFNFDITSGSYVQAEALFDVFDVLSSIGKERKRPEFYPNEGERNIGKRLNNGSGDP